ncbi:MAG TPA: hypothetical protein VFZ48_03600 [Candidatus Saccharimonadales bacterium]
MPNTIISSANLNLPIRRAMVGGHESHAEFLQQTGYDGFEVHPTRSRFTAEILLGAKAINLVTSLHQSFQDANLRDLLHGSKPLNLQNVAFASILPERKASMRYLTSLQARLEQQVPAVLYPEQQGTPRIFNFEHEQYDGVFASRLWQPTAEVLQRWGVLVRDTDTAIRGMLRAMKKEGFDNLCIDTFHWPATQDGESYMPPWQEALPQLAAAGHIKEVHFGPARPDFSDDSSQLKQILRGNIANTESGQMLATVAENMHCGETPYVVTELTHAAVTQLGYTDYTGVHRDLVQAIRETVSQHAA